MQTQKPWLLGLLVISLVLNTVAIARIGKLNEQVGRLSRDLQTVASNTHQTKYEVEHLSRMVGELQAEQRWLLTDQWTVLAEAIPAGCQGPLPVAFQWSFKELAPESQVAVEVRPSGAEQWQSIPAEQTGQLAYRAQAALDPQQGWEYRIVAVSAVGARASSPQPMYDLELVTRKAVILHDGDTYATGGRHWVRYVLEYQVPVLSPCNTVTAATLEVIHNGQVVQTVEMLDRRPTDDVPKELTEHGQSAAATQSEGPGLRNAWWTNWVELPDRRADARARITFADGETAVVELRGACCPPVR